MALGGGIPIKKSSKRLLCLIGISFVSWLVLGLDSSGISSAEANTGFRLQEATISDVHTALESGELTCRDLVRMYVDRIESYDDKGPSLKAVLAVNPDAMNTARSLDEQFASSGFSGPLHCVPVLLKDNYDTGGLATTAASRSLENSVPPDDATTVRKLREAGAVILAKTNLHEFAVSGETVSSLGGQTLNPYDLTRTPGGSSGGTGAGLAANFALLGTGTDTVNSIRSPSSANSLVGIRGTAGLVSRDGIVPVSFTQDAAGPMARTVEDAAAMLDVMAGYDPDDPITAASVDNVPETYLSALDAGALEGTRIGVLRNFFGEDPDLHGEVNEVANRAIKQMDELGAQTVPINIPGLSTDGLVEDLDVQVYEYKVNLNDYLGSFDAPKSSLDEIVDSGDYHPSVADVLEEANGVENGLQDPEYKDRLLKRDELHRQILQVMADNDLDVLVYPHQKRLVVPVGGSQEDRNGILAAATGLPAITVPGGFSDPSSSAPIGVPVGMEFLGRPWSEPELIGYAYAFEQATLHRRPPESTPPLPGETDASTAPARMPDTGGY